MVGGWLPGAFHCFSLYLMNVLKQTGNNKIPKLSGQCARINSCGNHRCFHSLLVVFCTPRASIEKLE